MTALHCIALGSHRDRIGIAQLFASLQVNLTEQEVDMVLAEVDDSGDGVLTFEEVIDWMQEKDLWDMEKAGEIYTPPDFSDDMHVLDRKELGATLSRYAFDHILYAYCIPILLSSRSIST
jgi:hypothetical protein